MIKDNDFLVSVLIALEFPETSITVYLSYSSRFRTNLIACVDRAALSMAADNRGVACGRLA